jgi:AraC family transcriptional regulator
MEFMSKVVIVEPNDGCKGSEISPLFNGSSARQVSSVELGWSGFTLERRRVDAAEHSEAAIARHYIILWDAHLYRGERADVRGRFAPYSKTPGMLSLCPSGILPAHRGFTETEAVICALDPVFVNGIEEELDLRPIESIHEQLGIHDAGLRQLTSLLEAEAKAGGPYGRLYADSLAHALATRFLYLGRAQKQQERSLKSAMPRHLLRRVLERMKSDFHADLDLPTLAAETGYSRAHFLRVFREATGTTPHRYLLDLRLEEAQRRLKELRAPLTDIALDCGFSSHSHLSKAFRHRLGVTPSQYRRKI